MRKVMCVVITYASIDLNKLAGVDSEPLWIIFVSQNIQTPFNFSEMDIATDGL